MKKILAVAGIMLVLGCSTPQLPVFFDGSFDDAKVLAEKEGKTILIDFYSLT